MVIPLPRLVQELLPPVHLPLVAVDFVEEILKVPKDLEFSALEEPLEVGDPGHDVLFGRADVYSPTLQRLKNLLA